MNKKDKLNNKVAVSPSVPLNCSAARDAAERETPRTKLFRHLRICWYCSTHQDYCATGEKLNRNFLLGGEG